MSPGLVGQLEELTSQTMQTFKGSLIRVCFEGGEETEPGATRRAHLYHHLQSKHEPTAMNDLQMSADNNSWEIHLVSLAYLLHIFLLFCFVFLLMKIPN